MLPVDDVEARRRDCAPRAASCRNQRPRVARALKLRSRGGRAGLDRQVGQDLMFWRHHIGQAQLAESRVQDFASRLGSGALRPDRSRRCCRGGDKGPTVRSLCPQHGALGADPRRAGSWRGGRSRDRLLRGRRGRWRGHRRRGGNDSSRRSEEPRLQLLLQPVHGALTPLLEYVSGSSTADPDAESGVAIAIGARAAPAGAR